MSNQDSSTYMEARKNNLRPEEAVTIGLRDLYGDEITEIIGLITKDLIYTTDMEKYLSRTNDKDLDYDTINIDYRKNRELEVYCSRNSRTDVGTNGRSVAEYFTLHIKQGSENADITIEANGPSTTHNKDLLLERVQGYAYPLNECVKSSNIIYDIITKPPVAVAPVAVVPPKPTNASTPAPGSVAARIAAFNKKGGRRSRRHRRKSRKSRKSHKKSRKSQRRQ